MKKYKIHIIQNSHTDLGYTHRQEYVYRAHARYIDYAIAMAENHSNFKYSLENFWMYENYCKQNGDAKIKKLNQFIREGKIEITANYLNLLNIFDKQAYDGKVKNAKKIFPNLEVAVQQDVNAISKSQALVLYKNKIKYIYASIHTHHGMFVGNGKQRGFVWNLGNNQKIIVWAGEHYMLGNELGIHLDTPNRYVFKDDLNLTSKSPIKIGAKRLKSYVKLLEKEGYKEKNIPIVMSGSVIDNSPPNIKILKGIELLQKEMGSNFEIKLSSFQNFFKSINQKDIPHFEGEWPSWWVDGIISTPESVRQYREAQILYKNLKSVNLKGNDIFLAKMKQLENFLLMFAEHTWGGWSSQSNPFANGNNLLLSRKKALANQASEIAWELWDEIKEKDGYNIVKINPTNQVVINNIHNKAIEKLIAIEIPRHLRGKSTVDRYINIEDILDIVDSSNQKYNYVISKKMGLSDNFNTSIESDEIILINVSLKANEKIKLFINKLKNNYQPRTSSYKKIGVDNVDDVVSNNIEFCNYIQNGIENKYYKILWNKNGIYSIWDKQLKTEMISKNKYIAFTRTLSNDQRHLLGRNRQGPSVEFFNSSIISHKILQNKKNGIIVKLVHKLVGARQIEIIIRLTSFEKSIRMQINFLKNGYLKIENMYLSVPFEHKQIKIETQEKWFTAGVEQLPLTNLDYYSCNKGVEFKNGDFSVGLTMHDTPLLQTGSLKFESRNLMGKILKKQNFNPRVWLMTNYWETNYKGSLEGCYSFAFDIFSGNNVTEKINNSDRNVIAYNIWK